MTQAIGVDVPRARSRLPLAVLGFVLAAAVLAVALYRPQPVVRQALPPGLRLDSEGVDLGLLSTTSTGSGTFRITNDGPVEYHVDRVVPDCGCMVAVTSDPDIGVHRTLEIPVKVNGSEWGDGLRTKHIAVILAGSTGAHFTLALSVTAAVRQVTPLAVMPAHFDLPDSRPGASISLSLFIRGDKAVVDEIPTTIALGDRGQTTVVVPATRLEGRSATREIKVSLRSPKTAGDIAVVKLLEIDVPGTQHQMIRVPIRFLHRAM